MSANVHGVTIDSTASLIMCKLDVSPDSKVGIGTIEINI